MREVIIIKYGELWLKSEPVRKRFAKRLADNIRRMLKAEKIAFDLIRLRDMLVLETKSRKAEEVLKRVFGISWFAKAKETKAGMRHIEEAVLEISERIKPHETFAIRASRSDKSLALSSREIEERTGSRVKRRVNLSKPDFTIFIETKTSKAYVYHEKVRGLGGLPYGVSGKAISMLSGGIDSPVASWMLMRRGCSLDFINFCTDGKEAYKAKKIVERLGEYSPERLNFHAVPYREILEGISRSCERKLTCVLCRRLMYRISERFAERVKAKAIVTGENLGQVASQTLDNLLANSGAVSVPVLRPLIGMDKEETISLSKRIGTFDISVKDAGTCSFVPRKPATKSVPEKASAEERRISNLDKLISKAIGGSEKVSV